MAGETGSITLNEALQTADDRRINVRLSALHMAIEAVRYGCSGHIDVVASAKAFAYFLDPEHHAAK